MVGKFLLDPSNVLLDEGLVYFDSILYIHGFKLKGRLAMYLRAEQRIASSDAFVTDLLSACRMFAFVLLSSVPVLHTASWHGLVRKGGFWSPRSLPFPMADGPI